MSVSKWAYSPEKCDGDFCIGECDKCPKAREDADHEVTVMPLEWTSVHSAKPAEKCIYPKCEECGEYVHECCTVPVVFTKQMYHLATELFNVIYERLDIMDELIDTEILDSGEKPS